MPELLILGTRGIPASHGGFETFAERLALYLVERDWVVTVYCQAEPEGASRRIVEDSWRGVRRVLVPVERAGSAGSILFDWRSVLDARHRPGQVLIFGYNTAVFNLLFRFWRRPIFINMDGIEWKRAKWSLPVKAWFWVNERLAALTKATLIADHPEIERRLARIAPSNKTIMIPYGADRVTSGSHAALEALGLVEDRYFISICRIEPENSILEIVKAFSIRPRQSKLVVLGSFNPEDNAYHRAIWNVASDSVVFPGSIYAREAVAALRLYARAYCHGHQVGGTNPSLVEALGAGSAVIAHNNVFNRWTAGPEQFYFGDVVHCTALFDRLDSDEGDAALRVARAAAAQRWQDGLNWDAVLSRYEAMLMPEMAVNVVRSTAAE